MAEHNLEEFEGSSGKRPRLDVALARQPTSVVKQTFTITFQESLNAFRSRQDTKQPGSIVVSLYCLGHPAMSDSLSQPRCFSKTFNEIIDISTCRQESYFFTKTEKTSDFFVDVSLSSTCKICRIEVKDGLHFGNITSISAGLNCLGTHDHWVHGHWQPKWSVKWPFPDSESSVLRDIPDKYHQAQSNVLRFEMKFNAQGCRFIDLTSFVRMGSICPAVLEPSVQEEQMELDNCNFKLVENLENFPENVLLKIVNSLNGEDRLKLITSLSGVCRRFRQILESGSLYEKCCLSNIKPANLTSPLFNFFEERIVKAGEIEHLDVSWLPHMPDGSSFNKFLKRLPPTLKYFSAEACPFVDDKVLKILSERQPNLEVLILNRCKSISQDAFRFVSNFSKLRHLSLRQTNIGEKPLVEIISKSTMLEILNISDLSWNSDQDFLESINDNGKNLIGRTLLESPVTSNLKALCFNLNNFDYEDSMSFLKRCNNLEELICLQPEFWQSNRLNSAVFDDIIKHCPKITRLSISENQMKQHFLNNLDFVKLTTELLDLQFFCAVPCDVSMPVSKIRYLFLLI